ncbi:MAG: DUF6259 domain-containing protein [Ruthenibacterium lactatiformans]
MREHGGFSTLYINARIFDVKSDFHKTVGEKMAVRNEKGEPYRETYGPEHFTVNCPSDTLWRDYLLDTAEFCVKAYGCDGIYLDQLASAEPFACYCAEHSHENIGEFNNGYVYVLRELLRRLRKHNPNAYIMTENCGDIYGSYTWGNLTWNGAEYDEYYNVFKYTFPEFVQVNMVNPRGWETEDRDQRLWFYRDMHRAVTLGSVLWMGITTRMRPQDGEYHIYGRKMARFRRELQPLLKEARFLDDAWLAPVPDFCYAACWQLADGRGMVLAANDTGAPCMLTVHGTAADGACTVKAPDGDAPGVRRDGDALLLALQPDRYAAFCSTGENGSSVPFRRRERYKAPISGMCRAEPFRL